MVACDLRQIGRLRKALVQLCEAAIRLARRDAAFARSRVFDWALPLPAQPSATEAIGLFRYIAQDPYLSPELREAAQLVNETLLNGVASNLSPFVFYGAKAGIALAIPDKKVLNIWSRNVENTESRRWDAYAHLRYAQDVPWLQLFMTIRDCQ